MKERGKKKRTSPLPNGKKHTCNDHTTHHTHTTDISKTHHMSGGSYRAHFMIAFRVRIRWEGTKDAVSVRTLTNHPPPQPPVPSTEKPHPPSVTPVPPSEADIKRTRRSGCGHVIIDRGEPTYRRGLRSHRRRGHGGGGRGGGHSGRRRGSVHGMRETDLAFGAALGASLCSQLLGCLQFRTLLTTTTIIISYTHQR